MTDPVDNSVPYPFYAELKEENRRLAEEYVELKDLYLKCRIDIGNLHKENELLRKAGDAMMEVLESEIPFTAMNAVNGWLAAKEGGAK